MDRERIAKVLGLLASLVGIPTVYWCWDHDQLLALRIIGAVLVCNVAAVAWSDGEVFDRNTGETVIMDGGL